MRYIGMVVLLFFLAGCVTTYRDFPSDALGKKPAPGDCDVLQYNVKPFNILDMGGYSGLKGVLKTSGICREVVVVDSKQDKGLYLEVETKWKPMTMPALIFGYISVSTLTILPFWSTKDGYDVKYHLYRDGQKQQTYQYEITRKTGMWLGLLPFAWINGLTYSEEDAFAATTYQFASDARNHFRAPLSGPRADKQR